MGKNLNIPAPEKNLGEDFFSLTEGAKLSEAAQQALTNFPDPPF